MAEDEQVVLSRAEVDALSEALRIKGRSATARVSLMRDENDVLWYRHFEGENWYPVQ